MSRKIRNDDYGCNADDIIKPAEEIAAWLADNKDLVKNYVSLDDDFDEEHYENFGLDGHLVRTDFFVDNESDGGLQEQHVEKAKKILKEEA